jgi:hypothetical protein
MAQAPAPKQYLFVSNRDISVTSILGYSIFFEKGVQTHVPRAMHAEVIEKGILPVEEDGKISVEAIDKMTSPDIKIVLAPETAEDRNEAIAEAVKAIVKRNDSRDFTSGGVPSAVAVTAALGWKVDPKEVRNVWATLRANLKTE